MKVVELVDRLEGQRGLRELVVQALKFGALGKRRIVSSVQQAGHEYKGGEHRVPPRSTTCEDAAGRMRIDVPRNRWKRPLRRPHDCPVGARLPHGSAR